MPKKYSYNGASFSYDQLLEKYGTDDNVQKAITQFGFKETKDTGEILPGKRKTVAKEDAGATVKSTASKPVKSSSASQSNPFGEDRSQPEFLTNLQKQAKTLVPKTKDVFNPKKFAKEVTSSDTDGFYTKGEKNIQKSGIKENKLEADIVDNVFNNFETLNYAKLTPEQKLDIDNQAVQILQTKQPAGASYNIQPADIELKAQEILTKASDKKNKIIGESYIDRLLDGVAKGSDYVGEAFASIPETVYRVFAAPQNIYAAISGDKDVEVTPEKFKKSMGVTNPMMDYFIDEQKRIGKKNNIYDNANYDSQSITKNISNGNYSDAFRLLGSGLAESAPVSIGFMAGGANMGIAKLAAASTAAMAGPEIRIQAEENPGQSEIENVINGFGMAGAESVFSAIGEGSIGKVYKDIILKEGLETGSKIFKDGLITTYQTALKKYGVPVSMLGEGLEEVATTVTQNLISKKPAFEGTMDSFVAGVGGGTVYGAPVTLQKSIQGFKSGVTTYKINTQLKDSGITNIKEAFNPATPISEAQMNIALIPNSYKILSNQVDTDVASDKITIEEGDNIKKEFATTYHAANQLKPLELPTNVNAEVANLLKDRAQLKTLIENVNDPILTTFQSDKVKELDSRISELTSTVAKEKLEKNLAVLNKNVGVAKKLAGLVGKQEFENPITNPDGTVDALVAFDTQEEGQKVLDEYNEKMGLPKSKLSNTVGTNLGNGQIIINKEFAAKVSEFNVGGHELLHKILISSFQTLTEKDLVKATELKDKFLSVLSAEELAAINDRILAEDKETGERLYDDEYLKENPDEYMTQFFEIVAGKKLTWSDKLSDMFAKIGDLILPFLKEKGFDNLQFQDGKDVYDFIKDYNKNLRRGKLSKRAIALGDQGKTISKSQTFSKTIAQLKTELSDLEENEGDYDPNEYDQEVKKLEGELKRAIAKEATAKPTTKKEVSEEDTVKEIIKNESGSISSNKVQQIYDTKGREGAAEIIKLFKPITNKIVDKRRDAPDFDRELLTDEIETGVGGILDLITKYKPESGTPLAAWINKYLPVRAIATSRRILGKQFSKDASEEKGLMATETADQGFTETAKEKPKYKNALEAKVFPTEVLETAIKKIITITRTLKTRIDAPVSLNKTVTPLIAEIRDEVGKQLDIDIKTMLGGKKDGVLRKELLRTKRYVLENMTTTWLMGKDGQGGIPMAIQKQIDGKWVNFPDWVGKKIDREKTTTDQAGRTSGAELVRRLPNVANNISDEVYLAQIIGPDGNPIRGRKESLSKAMSEEGAFDIINADFAEGGPIFEAFAANQTRQGYEIANNTVVDFARQSDRGNVKFSKIYNSFPQIKKDIFNSKINQLSADLNPYLTTSNKVAIKRIFKNVFIDDFSTEEINGLVEDFRPWLRQMKDMYSKNVKYVEDTNFNEKGNFESFIKNVATMHEEGVLDVLDMQFSHESLFSPTNVTDARTTTINMFSAWVDKFGKEEAIKMMIYSGGTFKSNASLGNLIGIQINPETKKVEFSGKKGRKSNQITESAADYWDNIVYNSLQNGATAENQLLVEKIKKATATQRKKDSASKAYKDRDFEGRKAQSLEYRKIVQETFSYYFNPENEISDAAKAIMIVQMGSNMETAIRKSAILTNVYIPKAGIEAGALRYEHTRPASQVIAEILNTYKKGKGIATKEDLANIWDTYTAAVIPVSMDNNFNKAGFKSKMPPGWKKGMPTYYRYYNYATFGMKNMFAMESIDPANKEIIGEEFVKASDNAVNGIKNDTKIKAIVNSSKFSKTPKGISVFDFDDTVGLTSGSVLYTMPDGLTGKLNAEEFAKEGGNMLDAGAVFDFSEFSKVVDGKPGPMVEKMKKMIGKFGPENFFILTARPANAAGPIHEFLSSIGINIPLENITGLGNSTAQAKADWMVNKATEGYNDFYFSDDAIQNVTAVKNALDVLDVKSKIQQAKIKFSKTIGSEFNKIIAKNTGIGPAIEYSDIVAKRKGAGKNVFDLYVPASAADFELLLYNFIGKGRDGEAQKEFFSDALLKPYANGNDLMDAARQSIKNNYKALIKAFPGIAKKLEKLTPDGNFTYDQALRVAMWNGSGVEIPGLSKRDTNELTSLVNNDTELYDFMSGLIVLGRQGNGWVNPDEYWDASTIISDLHNLTEGEGRKQFLSEFVDNAEQMFGKFENGKLVGPNMNKIQAIYGTDVRESIEDVLYRMINGKNRSQGKDKITNAWFDWVSGSTGTIMFLNTRSAALQLIGAVNFLNLRDNNPIAAAKAFANQKQYWKDFGRIWNSDKMKERRGGLKEDVAAAEIANAAATSKNKPKAVVAYLLKIGYTPTQIADSFAIASGGAPFYRNRIKTYLKEGQTEVEAEKNAWNDFTKVSDETQQSGDPRDISKQQASGAGRLLLTFQNTAMQQSRIVKKSFLDLKNGRGDAKTHITKIAYYIAIQNLMFATLQQGLFAVLPGLGDDEEKEEDKKKRLKEKDKKLVEIASSVVDSVVRGTGLLGGVMVTVKNVIKKYMEERPKEYKADYTKVLLETVNISPPIGSKLRKIYTGLQQTKYDKDLIKERGWGVMQDGRVHLGPLYSVAGKGVEATTNFPMDRLVTKVENISQALNSQNTAMQRTMIMLGWTPRSVGVGDTPGDTAIEAAGKATREEEGLIKADETRERTKDSISQLPASERMRLKIEGKLKRRENEIKSRERKANRKMG